MQRSPPLRVLAGVAFLTMTWGNLAAIRQKNVKRMLAYSSLIKSEPIAKKILVAMHLPWEAPELHPARPPPGRDCDGRDAEDYVN